MREGSRVEGLTSLQWAKPGPLLRQEDRVASITSVTMSDMARTDHDLGPAKKSKAYGTDGTASRRHLVVGESNRQSNDLLWPAFAPGRMASNTRSIGFHVGFQSCSSFGSDAAEALHWAWNARRRLRPKTMIPPNIALAGTIPIRPTCIFLPGLIKVTQAFRRAKKSRPSLLSLPWFGSY